MNTQTSPTSNPSQSVPLMMLAASACHVLETAAFAFAEPGGEDDWARFDSDSFDSAYLATLEMSGALQGVLSLAVPRELCDALSADILGEDSDEISAEQALDTLGELANVIAGRLVTDWLGDDVIVKLAPPERALLDLTGWDQLYERASSVLLLIDEQPLLLDLTLLEA